MKIEEWKEKREQKVRGRKRSKKYAVAAVAAVVVIVVGGREANTIFFR